MEGDNTNDSSSQTGLLANEGYGAGENCAISANDINSRTLEANCIRSRIKTTKDRQEKSWSREMKLALRRNLPKLCNTLKLTELYAHMESKEHLNSHDIAKIKSEGRVPFDENKEFLHYLENRTRKAYFDFLDGLIETNQAHLASIVVNEWVDLIREGELEIKSTEAFFYEKDFQTENHENSSASEESCLRTFHRKYFCATICSILMVIFMAISGSMALTRFNCDKCDSTSSTTSSSPTLPPTTWPQSFNMTDCYDYYHQHNVTVTGTQWISPQPDRYPVQAYCDMETAGGGWTVIQRRVDDSLMFLNKTRKEYKDGFNLQSATWLGWLGLENIHILSTKDDNVTLRIDLWTFDQTYLWGEWPVRIDGEGSRYKLNVGEMLAGNLDETENGTFRANHNLGQFFTASDGDNCASLQKNNKKYGPFWYAAPGARPAPKECGSAHLNGAYHTTQMSSDEGCGWMLSNQRWINPVRSEMKLRKNVHY